jgi:hypothetical protein
LLSEFHLEGAIPVALHPKHHWMPFQSSGANQSALSSVENRLALFPGLPAPQRAEGRLIYHGHFHACIALGTALIGVQDFLGFSCFPDYAKLGRMS